MIKLTSVVTSAVLVIIAAVSVFSQAAPPKSVLINTAAFYDERMGITKLVKAEKQLDGEFAAQIKDLQAKGARVQAIAAELQALPPNITNQETMAAKQEEGQRLQKQVEVDKEELEAAINKRRQTLIVPISEDIGKAIAEFGRKNGYGAIFDASKLADAGVLLFVGDTSDITKDFIAFYNSRSAATPSK